MKLMAESCGYEVGIASNGLRYQWCLAFSRPDLILLDETIWHGNAQVLEWGFLREAKIQDVPVIRIADAGSMGKKLPEGISGVVEKIGWKPTPMQKKRFKTVVEKVLREKK